jgi:hypothetical protein
MNLRLNLEQKIRIRRHLLEIAETADQIGTDIVDGKESRKPGPRDPLLARINRPKERGNFVQYGSGIVYARFRNELGEEYEVSVRRMGNDKFRS